MIGILPWKSEEEMTKIPRSTITFILICSIIHLITYLISRNSEELLKILVFITGYHFSAPPTAFTHIFIHGDFSHLFFNMLFFWVFAVPLELAEGKRKFWLLIIFSAFFASYFSTFVKYLFYLICYSGDEELNQLRYYSIFVPSIGASGIVSAFVMAYLIRFWRKKLYIMLMVGVFPIPKKIPVPAWALVLCYMVAKDLIKGVLFQGLLPISGIGHFAHLGGYVSGLILALYWKFHHKHKRDYFIEWAEDLAKAPITGALATLKTYQQALEQDPENGKILLELARANFNLSRFEESKNYYKKAILALEKEKQEKELAKTYAEAFENHQLIFLSEHQLELTRLLLKNKKWQIALKALLIFCQEIEQKHLKPTLSQLYIRAKLIICFILDQFQQDFSKARATLESLLSEFPNHPLLKYPKQRLEHYGEQDELFNFNLKKPDYPFIISKNHQPEKVNQTQKPKPPWYKIHKKFIKKLALTIAIAPVIIFSLTLFFYLLDLLLGDF